MSEIRLGILGGGQLGSMLSLAAKKLKSWRLSQTKSVKKNPK